MIVTLLLRDYCMQVIDPTEPSECLLDPRKLLAAQARPRSHVRAATYRIRTT